MSNRIPGWADHPERDTDNIAVPSTRTAEPRTAAGRRLRDTPWLAGGITVDVEGWLTETIIAIEAEAWDKGVDAGAQAYADDHPEAAASAGLDGRRLSDAMHAAGIRVGEQRVGEVVAHYGAAAPAELDVDGQHVYCSQCRRWLPIPTEAATTGVLRQIRDALRAEPPLWGDALRMAAAEYARLRQGQ